MVMMTIKTYFGCKKVKLLLSKDVSVLYWIMIMNNKTNQQVVYLLSIRDRDLQETNSYCVPVKIYSNLDLAI